MTDVKTTLEVILKLQDLMGQNSFFFNYNYAILEAVQSVVSS